MTQRSHDGGIDLKAIRKGIGDLSDADSVEYFVQAKRNDPTTSISVKKIRELKGIIPFGNKGVFITTSKFSKDAIKESSNDISKPVSLIDGKSLVESCIDNEIGFVFTPVFSSAVMDELTKTNDVNKGIASGNNATAAKGIVVDRQITANDIRARILVIPRLIMNVIPISEDKVHVIINGTIEKELRIDKGRRYLAGVTEIYRKEGLLSNDGSFTPKKAAWNYIDGIAYINIF